MLHDNPAGMSAQQADLRSEICDLDQVEYDRRRHEIAERHGVRLTTLDSIYATERSAGGPETVSKQGVPLIELIREIEPSPNVVDGVALLDSIAIAAKRYVRLPDGAADTIAAYAVYTHLFESFSTAPYLNFRSPAPECGKTTALTFLEHLCPRVLPTDSITVAGIFRALHAHYPLILSIDEVDAWLQHAGEDARGILNSGFSRGRYVVRTVGDDHEPRGFQVYGPKLLSGIGALPGTIDSRSIVIPMERVTARESRELALRSLERGDNPPELLDLARRTARWARDHRDAVASVRVTHGLSRREADKWRPLFAIAEVAGETWPERLKAASRQLRPEAEADTESLDLLGDVGEYLGGLGWPKFISTARLLHHIQNPENGLDWPSGGPGRLTAKRLASRLREFRGIRPRSNGTERGYATEPIRRAFERYVSDPDGASRQCVKALEVTEEIDEATRQPLLPEQAGTTPKSPKENAQLDALTDPPEGRPSHPGGPSELPPARPGPDA